jgi:hypothetical protein
MRTRTCQPKSPVAEQRRNAPAADADDDGPRALEQVRNAETRAELSAAIEVAYSATSGRPELTNALVYLIRESATRLAAQDRERVRRFKACAGRRIDRRE